jgi:hypothetical protein
MASLASLFYQADVSYRRSPLDASGITGIDCLHADLRSSNNTSGKHVFSLHPASSTSFLIVRLVFDVSLSRLSANSIKLKEE